MCKKSRRKIEESVVYWERTGSCGNSSWLWQRRDRPRSAGEGDTKQRADFVIRGTALKIISIFLTCPGWHRLFCFFPDLSPNHPSPPARLRHLAKREKAYFSFSSYIILDKSIFSFSFLPLITIYNYRLSPLYLLFTYPNSWATLETRSLEYFLRSAWSKRSLVQEQQHLCNHHHLSPLLLSTYPGTRHHRRYPQPLLPRATTSSSPMTNVAITSHEIPPLHSLPHLATHPTTTTTTTM